MIYDNWNVVIWCITKYEVIFGDGGGITGRGAMVGVTRCGTGVCSSHICEYGGGVIIPLWAVWGTVPSNISGGRVVIGVPSEIVVELGSSGTGTGLTQAGHEWVVALGVYCKNDGEFRRCLN